MNKGEDVLKLDQNKAPEQNRNVQNDKNNNTDIFIKSEDRQTFNPIIAQSPISVINNGDIFSRLMNTKMVRIHVSSRCACVQGCREIFYSVNTISRIDDINPANENEIPLFEISENHDCYLCPSCKPAGLKFDVFDAVTKQLISNFETRKNLTRIQECCGMCGDDYLVYPTIYNYKCSNINDMSTVKRYDSRSFYRTFEYLGKAYYKIGEPYIPTELTCAECCCQCITCLPCCCCCRGGCKSEKTPCCECCKTIEVDKRTYIDIYTMDNQSVGKFVRFYDETSSCCGCCCNSKTLFHEIYFPPDANDLLRLALIGQMIFFLFLKKNYFGLLPGTKDNLNQFII